MTARAIFISYARKDRAQVAALSETLRLLGNHVWLDESLTGGATWWAEILKQIEQCHIFLYVLSRSSLKSEACTAEKAYALDLHKPLLPVMVEPVGAASLPADLAQLHIVKYTDANQEGVIRLVNAVQGMPEALALPSPMPQRPPVPVSYLSQLGLQARSATTADEQIVAISRLGAVAESDDDAEKRAEAQAIIDDMARRHDLMAEAEHQIRIVKERLHTLPSRSSPPQPAPSPQASPSPDVTPATPVPSAAQATPLDQPPPARGQVRPQPLTARAVVHPAKVPPVPPKARSPWLIPIIVCGAAVVLVLLAVCLWAALGGGESESMSASTLSATVAGTQAQGVEPGHESPPQG